MKPTLLFPALVLALVISSSSETFAFGGPPGGPFSNGSYFPNDGTFSAVVRGENLTGTLQFSTSSNSSSTGVASIYYDGNSYVGNSQGAMNPVESSMTVNFQAGIELQGEQQFEVMEVVDLGDITTSTTTISPDGTFVTVDTVTPQRQLEPETSVIYFDSLYLNGSADCKTSNAFPNQNFKGSGEANYQFLNTGQGDTPILDKKTLSISISGVRLSNSSAFFNTVEVRPPSVNQATVLNNAN
jgi:hypothetical protein